MIGVGIVAFNRPAYLRRLLASLAAQTEKDGAQYHLFLDGAVNKWSGKRYAYQHEIDQCTRLFARAELPAKWVTLRGSNVGVGVNTLEAIEELTATYERVILMEDDVVLSPHWLRLACILFEDMPAAAFSFSPGFKRAGTDRGAMVSRRSYMWCECFTADRWGKVRETYLDFYNKFIADRDYYSRDLDAIREWHRVHGIDEKVTSQDAGRLTAITVNGLNRYQCAVNRAYGIGKNGIHFSPDLYAFEQFAKQTPFIFDDDATREGFVWDD